MLGFIARFGLLTYPVWRAYRRVKRIPNRSDQILVACVGLTTAMVSVDLLPNGMFTYFPHLLAGVLLGASRELSRRESAPLPARASVPAPRAHSVRPPVAAREQRA